MNITPTRKNFSYILLLIVSFITLLTTNYVFGSDSFFAQADKVSLQGQSAPTAIGDCIQIVNSNGLRDTGSSNAIRYNAAVDVVDYCGDANWNSTNKFYSAGCDWSCQLGSASSIGGAYSCALKIDNTVECWGDNNDGQTTVPKGLIAKQIALGTYHACALKIDNTVECWGNNDAGQTTVPKGLIAKQIASGWFYSCALKTDNTVECWGWNISNQTQVPDNLKAKQIASGLWHSCALKADNTVVCWGNNNFKQAKVPDNLKAQQIALRRGYTCALKTDNTVECWGNNTRNQTQVPDNLSAKQLSNETFA